MQTPGAYAPSPYQIPYHTVIPGPQDHELKKQYLTLLPPQQIIEICLNFDLHVPPYVKSSIWPADINAAIQAIQRSLPNASETPSALTSASSSINAPPRDDDPHSESINHSQTTSTSIESSSEAQPPDKSSSTPDPSASAQTSTQPSPAPPEQANSSTPTPQNPSAATQQQPSYQNQPYGYGTYPHAPYYHHAPGYPPYPSPYPYGTYPPPPSGYTPQPNVPYGTPPLAHPQPPPPPPQDAFNSTMSQNNDDLPSYEEMIVEALTDSTDQEGCAPRDLFAWMASRYPLQSNFRPSASQALQKAFKRGRFEKSSSGKYRLNASWEGGNTSRRATRRPQTQNAAAGQQGPAPPPFTHAPLMHHHQTQPQPGHGYQPSAYGYPYSHQPGYSSFMQPPSQTMKAQQTSQPATSQPLSSTAPGSSSGLPPPAEGAAQDAWEAAQNILKAINFDSLLQISKGEEGAAGGAIASGHAATLAPSSSTGASVVNNTDASGLTAEHAASRAELQANLALLAAQLAEIAQEDDGGPMVQYPVLTSTGGSSTPLAAAAVISQAVTPLPASENVSNSTEGVQTPLLKTPSTTSLPIAEAQEEEEDSEDEMEEVI